MTITCKHPSSFNQKNQSKQQSNKCTHTKGWEKNPAQNYHLPEESYWLGSQEIVNSASLSFWTSQPPAIRSRITEQHTNGCERQWWGTATNSFTSSAIWSTMIALEQCLAPADNNQVKATNVHLGYCWQFNSCARQTLAPSEPFGCQTHILWR